MLYKVQHLVGNVVVANFVGSFRNPVFASKDTTMSEIVKGISLLEEAKSMAQRTAGIDKRSDSMSPQLPELPGSAVKAPTIVPLVWDEVMS
ncbi:hypothetical protein HDU86_003383 [Geranomyces michiganensis]|nr:hypothetical protein HDU86_003383 [Geranomyces michiganensis]